MQSPRAREPGSLDLGGGCLSPRPLSLGDSPQGPKTLRETPQPQTPEGGPLLPEESHALSLRRLTGADESLLHRCVAFGSRAASQHSTFFC